jgi:hypothetical protein
MSKPNLLIDSVTFSDGTIVEFEDDDVIVLVGPNNAGKSVALKNIKEKANRREFIGVVITDISFKTNGDENDLINWLEERFRKRLDNPSDPSFQSFDSAVTISQAKAWWTNNQGGFIHLANFFVYLLTTEVRLNASNPAQSISLTQDPLTHPIHYMQVNDEVELRISSYFRQAFGQDLIVHRNAGNIVPLYCGERPVPTLGQDRVSLDYIKSLEKLPPLHTQGDGMRSFVGVLLHSLIVNHSVLLIDEPEAFLHPPQARLLGRMLIEKSSRDRQMVIATHSGDFLRGILDANSDRVRIIRLQRDGNLNIVAELKNEGIRNVWQDPILRYSNILDGLFHNKIIVGESDSDARFYAAMSDAVFTEKEGKARQDIMFLQCGGKARLPVVIQSLKNLKVPVSAVADFDILSSEQPLRAVYESLGGSWTDISSDWFLVKTSIEQKKPELNSEEVSKEITAVLGGISEAMFPKEARERIQRILKRSSPWSIAKEIGKAFVPPGDPTRACNRLLESLRIRGLFVVEVGELEGFAKSVSGHGPKWVNAVLTKDLANDPELENARQFIRAVIK